MCFLTLRLVPNRFAPNFLFGKGVFFVHSRLFYLLLLQGFRVPAEKLKISNPSQVSAYAIRHCRSISVFMSSDRHKSTSELKKTPLALPATIKIGVEKG